ncbi:MAG: hypothetical protein ACFFC7_03960 [Candidatus Hermodarchaeota archaeon]
MRFILLGPPDAGKGTITKMMVKDMNNFKILARNILQPAVKEGTELSGGP